MALAQNGIFPSFMARLSGFAMPLPALLVNFAMSGLFFAILPFDEIVALNTAALVLTLVLGPLGLVALRTLMPEAKRGFRLPLATPLSAAAFVVATMIVYWGGRETAIHLAEAIGVGLILFAVHLVRTGAGAMDIRQGLWLAPYLAGLFALCWLGPYDSGLGILPFGWDMLAVGAFALAVFAYAVRCHLPPEKFRTHLAEEDAMAEPPGF